MRTHGLASTYRHGCRCDDCREAHRVAHAAQRAALAARPRAQVPHGTSGGYDNWLCRCEKCTAAKSVKNAARRSRGKEGAVQPAHRPEPPPVLTATGGAR